MPPRSPPRGTRPHRPAPGCGSASGWQRSGAPNEGTDKTSAAYWCRCCAARREHRRRRENPESLRPAAVRRTACVSGTPGLGPCARAQTTWSGCPPASTNRTSGRRARRSAPRQTANRALDTLRRFRCRGSVGASVAKPARSCRRIRVSLEHRDRSLTRASSR